MLCYRKFTPLIEHRSTEKYWLAIQRLSFHNQYTDFPKVGDCTVITFIRLVPWMQRHFECNQSVAHWPAVYAHKHKPFEFAFSSDHSHWRLNNETLFACRSSGKSVPWNFPILVKLISDQTNYHVPFCPLDTANCIRSDGTSIMQGRISHSHSWKFVIGRSWCKNAIPLSDHELPGITHISMALWRKNWKVSWLKGQTKSIFHCNDLLDPIFGEQLPKNLITVGEVHIINSPGLNT